MPHHHQTPDVLLSDRPYARKMVWRCSKQIKQRHPMFSMHLMTAHFRSGRRGQLISRARDYLPKPLASMKPSPVDAGEVHHYQEQQRRGMALVK